MPRKPSERVYWRCKCDCGNETIVFGQSLRNGVTTSCGCYQRKTVSRMMKKSEIGNRYGKLIVVGESPNRYHGYIRWYCKCDCGNEKEVDSRALRRGLVKSCGCLRRGRKKN
jgi:ribosomal protein S27E